MRIKSPTQLRGILVMQLRSKSKGEIKADPIDDDEQDRVINELKAEAAKQSTLIRRIFHYLFLVIGIVQMVSLLYTVYSPWEMDHQRHFKGIIPLHGFFSFYVGSIYCFFVSAWIVQDRSRVSSMLLYPAYIIASLSGAVWLGYFYQYRVTHPALYWLPLGNVLSLSLAKYVDKDYQQLTAQVEGMEELKYSHKSI